MKDAESRVVETQEYEFKEPLAVLGFPDIGLVGTIAVSHIIKTLDLTEIGYLESANLPPIIVVHDRRPQSPVRIYGSEKLLVVISEIPIPFSLIREVSASLVDWLKEKEVSRAILLGGIGNLKRLEIEKPSIYGVASDEEGDRAIETGKIKFFEEGFLTGQDGIILRTCMKKGLQSIYLMADSHYSYPDPGAAAAVIDALNRISGLNIEVKLLLEKEEEIRILTRDLMRRTQENLAAMKKAQEQEIPIMYR